jgi:uncharacterized protein (DUF2384 family)
MTPLFLLFLAVNVRDGRSTPFGSPGRQRLLKLAYVVDALAEVLRRDEANMWMFSPNRLLEHRKPAQLVREGQCQRVLVLIDAMAEGVFV